MASSLTCCMFVIIAIAYVLSHALVEGRQIAKNIELLVKHKGTVKTIESEDGDVIDCVDIYKQPAFNHPFLKNHTIQMKPSSYPNGMKLGTSKGELIQVWHNNGQCPKGTIPIRRTRKHDYHRAIPIHRHRTKLNHSFDGPSGFGNEYAMVSANGLFYGAHASVNVWNPTLDMDASLSASQVWVLSGTGEITNVAEAGWVVNPSKYRDRQTRFFIYWTKDNYESTGCYDLDCPGFVQTSQKIALGSVINPVSGYNAKQFHIAIAIHKDKMSGNWWLQLQDTELGYWPGSIFTATELADCASEVSWAGQIFNEKPDGHHTATQMGSGHFPNEGYGKSSFFRNLGIIDDSNTLRDPEKLQPVVTNPSCYDLHIEDNKNDGFGTHFYYGGPGYSVKCP